jgi:hypothetical protein
MKISREPKLLKELQQIQEALKNLEPIVDTDGEISIEQYEEFKTVRFNIRDAIFKWGGKVDKHLSNLMNPSYKAKKSTKKKPTLDFTKPLFKEEPKEKFEITSDKTIETKGSVRIVKVERVETPKIAPDTSFEEAQGQSLKPWHTENDPDDLPF